MIKKLEKIKKGAQWIKSLFIRQKHANLKRLFKNPLFAFGLLAFILLGTVSFGNNSFADLNSLKNSNIVFFNTFSKDNNIEKNNLFFSKNEVLSLETPDLKITQDNSVYGISTPRVLTTQVLGSIFGGSPEDKKDVIDYAVQPGDTIESIADNFKISVNTLLWANNLSKNASLKAGQTLVVLPVSGIIHVVKSGDTISEISKTYKAKIDDVVSFNELASESDIFVGDILIIPGGVMPQKAPVAPYQAPLASSFFIFPTEGTISQGLHFYNAVDTSNKCGTSIHAAAPGQVQKVKYGYNFGGGNYITILHSNGVVTYYGHLMTIFVKPGDMVDVGERIALIGGAPGMAGAGRSTGCHLHFGVMGAKNPLAKYGIGASIRYSK
ncbi:MAG: LysM peptidoglycan-binding domain-containing protein [Candidatus Staskawiczbacteria bacterium]|nr:LysM peptidoglycan-binding domain-containing protein [Candidatus Staskawiczbacteria bacterium]